MNLSLKTLEPSFLTYTESGKFTLHDQFENADGIVFLCPKCFTVNGGPTATHSIICWTDKVPQDTVPGPGRWIFTGTGYDDLTLTPSVMLPDGCAWHGFIRQGAVTDA